MSVTTFLWALSWLFPFLMRLLALKYVNETNAVRDLHRYVIHRLGEFCRLSGDDIFTAHINTANPWAISTILWITSLAFIGCFVVLLPLLYSHWLLLMNCIALHTIENGDESNLLSWVSYLSGFLLGHLPQFRRGWSLHFVYWRGLSPLLPISWWMTTSYWKKNAYKTNHY